MPEVWNPLTRRYFEVDDATAAEMTMPTRALGPPGSGLGGQATRTIYNPVTRGQMPVTEEEHRYLSTGGHFPGDIYRTSEPLAVEEQPGINWADYGKQILAGTIGTVNIGFKGIGYGIKEAGYDDFGQAVQDYGTNAVRYWEDSISDQGKEDLAKHFVQRNQETGDLEWGDANFNTVMLQGLGSLGPTVAGFGVGGALFKGLSGVLKLFGNNVNRTLLKEAAQVVLQPALKASASPQQLKIGAEALRKLRFIDKALGIPSFGIGEGAIGGAFTGVNVYDRVTALPLEKLQGNDRWRQVYESTDPGMGEADRISYATETVAREAGTTAGFQAGITTALLGAPMGAFFGSMLGKVGTRGAFTSTRLRTGATAALGETGQEAAQSFVEEGIATREVTAISGEDVDWLTESINAAVGGGLAGFMLGGTVGSTIGYKPTGEAATKPGPRTERPGTPQQTLMNAATQAMQAGATRDQVGAIISSKAPVIKKLKDLRELIAGEPAQPAVEPEGPQTFPGQPQPVTPTPRPDVAPAGAPAEPAAPVQASEYTGPEHVKVGDTVSWESGDSTLNGVVEGVDASLVTVRTPAGGVAKVGRNSILPGVTPGAPGAEQLHPEQQEFVDRAKADFEEHGVGTHHRDSIVEALESNVGPEAASAYQTEYDRLIDEAVEAREGGADPLIGQTVRFTDDQGNDLVGQVMRRIDREADEAGGVSVPAFAGYTVMVPGAQAANLVADGQFQEVATPQDLDVRSDIDQEAHEAAPSPLNDLTPPTDREVAAENFKVGRIPGPQVGLPRQNLSMEFPRGSERNGITMRHHYGRATGGKLSADGMGLDFFVGEQDTDEAFLFHRFDELGRFEQHKALINMSLEEATETLKEFYRDEYEKGDILVLNKADLDEWMETGDTSIPHPEARKRVQNLNLAQGDTQTSYTQDGREIQTQYELRELDELIISHDTEGNPNPRFPNPLQGRGRDRPEMVQWIRETAQGDRFVPALIAEGSSVASGPPIIAADGVVESGNGRALLVSKLNAEDDAGAYNVYLAENAEKFGLDPEAVTDFQEPVLVRVRQGSMSMDERISFATEANAPVGAVMSATETAAEDVGRLTPEMLGLFNSDATLGAAGNSGFVGAFIQSLPTAERNRYIDAKGHATQQAYDRLEAALFELAYGDIDLTAMMAESKDNDVKNIIAAMKSAAPAFAGARVAGANTDLIIEPLIEAVAIIRNTRKEQMALDEYLEEQLVPFEPGVERLATFLDEHVRSAKRMRQGMIALAEALEAEAQRASNEDMFGAPPAADFEQTVAAANAQLLEVEDAPMLSRAGRPWSMNRRGEGDLYIDRVGPNAGRPTKERTGPNQIAMTLNQEAIVPDYMFYLLQYLQPKIAGRAKGTAQQTITMRDIEEVLTEHFRETAPRLRIRMTQDPLEPGFELYSRKGPGLAPAREAELDRRLHALGLSEEAQKADVTERIGKDYERQGFFVEAINPKVKEGVVALNEAGIKTTMSGDLYGDDLVYLDLEARPSFTPGQASLPEGWQISSTTAAVTLHEVAGAPLPEHLAERGFQRYERRRLARAGAAPITETEAAQIVTALRTKPMFARKGTKPGDVLKLPTGVAATLEVEIIDNQMGGRDPGFQLISQNYDGNGPTLAVPDNGDAIAAMADSIDQIIQTTEGGALAGLNTLHERLMDAHAQTQQQDDMFDQAPDQGALFSRSGVISGRILGQQDFGDLVMTEEYGIEGTNEVVELAEPAQAMFDREAQRVQNLRALQECVRL